MLPIPEYIYLFFRTNTNRTVAIGIGIDFVYVHLSAARKRWIFSFEWALGKNRGAEDVEREGEWGGDAVYPARESIPNRHDATLPPPSPFPLPPLPLFPSPSLNFP